MKRLLFKNFFYYLLVLAVLSGCSKFETESKNTTAKKHKLTFSINKNTLYDYIDNVNTKNILLSLDTNRFLLKIYDSDGGKIYDGKYINRPSEFYITKGSYDVELLSCKFTEPTFDKPQIGEKKTIVVDDSESVHVSFNCKQINCGLKLNFDSGFKKRFYGVGVNIVQNNNSLLYSYNENRYVYLSTDPFEICAKQNGRDTTVFVRNLDASQMFNLNLSYAEVKGKGASFNYSCDSSRQWLKGNVNLWFNLPTGCLTIAEAKTKVGEKNIMVFGYIYGGDPTANSIRVAPPFSSRTTIIIAPSMKERNINNFMAVELPAGEVRDGLNLVVHKKLIGKPVVVWGNVVESYYGMTGLKSTKKYILL